MLNAEQLRFIETVAQLGTPRLAATSMDISYGVYREWHRGNEEFREEIKQAEGYFVEGINHTLGVLAKRELLNILMNGIVEQTTVYKSITGPEDEQGNTSIVGQERTVKRVQKGAPGWAIKEALKLVPGIQEVIEALATYNALPSEKLEATRRATIDYENQLRTLVDNKQEQQSETPQEIIAALQRALVGEV